MTDKDHGDYDRFQGHEYMDEEKNIVKENLLFYLKHQNSSMIVGI